MQGDGAFKAGRGDDLGHASEILAKVIDRLAAWGLQDGCDGETFNVADRLARLRDEDGRIKIPLLDMKHGTWGNEILIFPIIDAGGTDEALSGLPRKVRRDRHVADKKFREGGRLIPITDVVAVSGES